MKEPRNLTLLRKKALKLHRTILILGSALGLFLVIAGLVAGITGPTSVSSILFTLILGCAILGVGFVSYRRRAAPSSFTLAEKTKYYVDLLRRDCEDYTNASGDEEEKGKASRKVRRTAALLLMELLRFLPEDQRGALKSVSVSDANLDLFTNDLRSFAGGIADLVRRIAMAAREQRPLALILQTTLDDLVRALEDDPQIYGPYHRQLVETAASIARGLASGPDMTLGVSGAEASEKTARALRSLPPVARLLIVSVLLSVAYWFVVGAVKEVGLSLTIDTKILGYFALLTTIFAAWAVVKR